MLSQLCHFVLREESLTCPVYIFFEYSIPMGWLTKVRRSLKMKVRHPWPVTYHAWSQMKYHFLFSDAYDHIIIQVKKYPNPSIFFACMQRWTTADLATWPTHRGSSISSTTIRYQTARISENFREHPRLSDFPSLYENLREYPTF